MNMDVLFFENLCFQIWFAFIIHNNEFTIYTMYLPLFGRELRINKNNK